MSEAMFTSYKTLAISALCIMLILPIASGKATMICTPIAFLVVACLLVKPLMLTLSSSQWLSDYVNSTVLPDWTNECIDQNVTIDFSGFESQRDEIEFISGQMFILSVLMAIYCCMVALCALGPGTFFLCACLEKIFGGCGCLNNIGNNLRYLPKEAKHFLFLKYLILN